TNLLSLHDALPICQIPHLAPSFAPGKGILVLQWRDCDQERGDAWPRRERDRTFSDHGRFARRWLRSFNNGPVLAPNPETFAGRRLRHTGPIQLLRRYRT